MFLKYAKEVFKIKPNLLNFRNIYENFKTH